MGTAPDTLIGMSSEDRQKLASALKNLRIAAGVSTTKLAERLGWSQSKVSKTETGKTMPSPEDVEAWAREFGALADVQAELIEIATQAAQRVAERRQELAPGRRKLADLQEALDLQSERLAQIEDVQRQQSEKLDAILAVLRGDQPTSE